MTLFIIIISMTIKHLVISGGGPTMFQSLGAIQYLEQNGYLNLNNIETIYGTSAGAFVSVFIENKCYIDGGITCNYPLNNPFFVYASKIVCALIENILCHGLLIT